MKCIRLKSVVVSLICGIFSTQLRILMVVSAMKISEQDFGFDLEILGAVLWNEDKAVMPNDLTNPLFVKFHLHGFLSPPNCSKKFLPHAWRCPNWHLSKEWVVKKIGIHFASPSTSMTLHVRNSEAGLTMIALRPARNPVKEFRAPEFVLKLFYLLHHLS